MEESEFRKLCESQFMQEYIQILDDSKFNVYISRDSWNPTSVRKRYEIINELIRKYTV